MSETPKDSLLDAFKKVFRPFIAVLLRNGISIAEFMEAMKTAFVEVAANEFEVPGKKMSQSRVAIVTGLTRKEVARIIKEEHQRLFGYEGSAQGRSARVLQGWHKDADYIGPYGMPSDLPYDSEDKEPSFSQLVKRHSGDMPARAMLDELMRIGAVEETRDGLYRVLSRTYIAPSLSSAQLENFKEALDDFHRTVTLNLERESVAGGRLQRRVFSDELLTDSELVEFESYARASTQGFLEETDDWLAKKIAGRRSEFIPSNARVAGVGVYYFVKDQPKYMELSDIFGEKEIQHED